jgi:hypothetical protein
MNSRIERTVVRGTFSAMLIITSVYRVGCSRPELGVVTDAARKFNRAQAAYATAHPDIGFACDLSTLGADGFLDQGLASGRRDGYVFAIVDCKHHEQLAIGYVWVATPEAVVNAKPMVFCGDETGAIKMSSTAANDCLRAGQPVR